MWLFDHQVLITSSVSPSEHLQQIQRHLLEVRLISSSWDWDRWTEMWWKRHETSWVWHRHRPVSHLGPVGSKAAEVVEVCESIRETHQAAVSFCSVQLQAQVIWGWGWKHRREVRRLRNRRVVTYVTIKLNTCNDTYKTTCITSCFQFRTWPRYI